jgi:hypothetical protein
MALFNPNTPCLIYATGAKHDLYGQPKLSIRAREKCAIVKMVLAAQKTSVRADSSASRGAADEVIADAVLLFPPYTKVGVDDLIDIMGVALKVTGKAPKVSLDGRLDHYRVSCMIATEIKPNAA